MTDANHDQRPMTEAEVRIIALLEQIRDQNGTIIVALQTQTRLLSANGGKPHEAARVKIIDADMPFFSSVGLVSQIMIASIPIGLLFWFVGGIIEVMFGR